MRFIEVRKDLLRIETVNPPSDDLEPLHVHPYQESGAEVLSGSLVFEVAGARTTLAPGESISVALAAAGKLDARGMPRPLQLAVMVPEFGREIRPVGIPWPLLRSLALLLGPIARARGYRARMSSGTETAPKPSVRNFDTPGT